MEIEIPKCLLAAAHNMLNTLPVDPTWLLGHTNCCAEFTDVVLHQSSRDQYLARPSLQRFGAMCANHRFICDS